MQLQNNILTLKEGEEVIIKVPSKEEYPCTDNAGKDVDPIVLGYTAGSCDYDSVFVKDIIVQERNEWCACEYLGGALKYTALESNPTNEDRTIYFEHKTNDSLLSAGPNKGKSAMKSWIVTVTQKANPKKEEPVQEQSVNLGNYMFSVGLLSDLHISADNNGTTDDWWDENDFNRSMNIFKEDQNIKFIASCGDILECGSPAKSTPQDDYNDFYNLYNVPYWQVTGLRFFTPIGNHDFYGMFESRAGDTLLPDRFTNYNSVSGRNQGVLNRIGELSIGGQGINGIVPTRGRIVFDTDDGKTHTNGQGDMQFMAYNAYVEMYKNAAGYTKSIVPSENRLSDEAVSTMKTYIYNNWNKYKDDISGFRNGYIGMRNGYSKLNYYLKKDNNIFIFLSLDYGEDLWGLNNVWHDRMIHARTIINLDTDDPYIKRMKEYIADTGYSTADEPYNYQYYSPNSLIWLKEIIENNTDKKIYVFTHHSLPNKVGNSAGIPQNGDWQYADISKAGDLTPDGLNKGSNMLTGIEYWFLNKLNNKYKNVIWFSGHSHISWDVDCHFVNKDYEIVSPTKQNKFIYSKANNNYKTVSAWNVALPSMSKPRYIGTNGKSSRLYDDAELGIMEIYENGVKIKGYKVKEKNKDVLNLVTEKTIMLL